MAKATAIFDGDDSRLQAAIKRIDNALIGVQAKFAKFAGFSAKLLAAPAAAAAALAVGIANALNVAGTFLDLQNQTGVAVEDLAILGQEARNSGRSIEDVAGAVNRMQKALATGSADDTLAQLGFNLEELKAQAPLEQFQGIGKAIAGLQSPADRAAAAMAIFGKSGAGRLSMFASKGFGDAGKQVGAQAQILARNAALFDDAGDKLALVGLKMQGVFVGVADRIVPVLLPLLDRFAGLDLAPLGQQLGDVIATAATALGDGTFGRIILAALNVSLGKAINFFVGGMLAGIPAFIAALQTALAALFTKLGLETLGSIAAANAAGNTGIAEKAFKVGAIFDIEGLQRELETAIGKSFDASRVAAGKARANFPANKPGAGGVGELDFSSGGAPNVSALQRIGGAFGAGLGGSDPLLDATRQTNDILQKILTATLGRPVGSMELTATYG